MGIAVQQASSHVEDLSMNSAASAAGPQLNPLIIVKLTLKPQDTSSTSRQQFERFIRSKLGARLAWHVKKVVPFAQGREVKVFLCDVAEAVYKDEIVGVFESVSTVVKRLTREEIQEQNEFDRFFGQKKKADKAQVADLKATNDLVSQLAALRGSGGRAAKRRRFADRGMQLLSISQTVAAQGLVPQNDDLSSDEAGDHQS